ncbi:tetratricopeptide repeat protein [Sedimenticola sp.]|uniref:tetratricopeptide repeat protein n=1 Tax=Sedimenticola sp. TaxID=1940285 RepID=UPI003D0D4078
MDESRYRTLRRVAVVLTIAWIGWTLYDGRPIASTATSRELAAADRYLEDGEFQQALSSFNRVYAQDPDNLGALRGQAQAWMRLGMQRAQQASQLDPARQQEIDRLRSESVQQLAQALTLYDKAIEGERVAGVSESNRRAQGVALANRGILKDRLGDYRGALADYRAGLELEPELAEGPGWLTRFLRNQSQRPPTVADRARYLAEQLAKPEAERVMRNPELDNRQRAYRLD